MSMADAIIIIIMVTMARRGANVAPATGSWHACGACDCWCALLLTAILFNFMITSHTWAPPFDDRAHPHSRLRLRKDLLEHLAASRVGATSPWF